jgi:hypothetical protein
LNIKLRQDKKKAAVQRMRISFTFLFVMESSTPNELVGLLLSINDIDTLQTNTHLLTSLNSLTVEQLADTNPNDPLTVLNPRLHSLGYFYFV